MAFFSQVQKGASPPAHEPGIGYKPKQFIMFDRVQRRCFDQALSRV
jgi:hypothetical protein